MSVSRQKFSKKTIYGLVVGVLVGAACALALPSRPAFAAQALCYNKLAGSPPYFCGGETSFADDKCYTLADIDKGWELTDCEEDVFKQALGAQPIGRTEDPANRTDCTAGDCDIVAKILNPIINFLAAAVGIIVTIMIIIGGIQYGSSADDPQKVAAAKSKIINAILALAGFLFLWAILQWILPGGVF